MWMREGDEIQSKFIEKRVSFDLVLLSQALLDLPFLSPSVFFPERIFLLFVLSLIPESDVDKDDAGKKMWVPIGGSLLVIPAWYMAIHSTSFEYSMAWLALEYMVAECWFGPTINVLQSTVNSKVEGTAQGMFAFTGVLRNLAPTMLGFAIANSSSGQSQETTPTELAGLLSIAVCGGYILSAIYFAMSATSTTQTTKKTL